MWACLTWQGYRDAKARALSKRERIATRQKRMQSQKRTGIRHTKASRGHTKKPDPPKSYAEEFKIKRFRDIEGYKIDDKW